ncbi:sugar ABC transporter permease [Tessaracoccus sp. OS52]|uniref:carbohydrate ABC transporter permease n=1 Tax=Tessaracoccus sp. OS52 TaxID=2886691 RepID=UPI001D10F4D8|nr:sugar ABC transporter permease [Tessaracoccus sp. OS52]MCC2594029.1 sugar ABC transporter permease [Tessaracoccus sp. OS52]
MNSRIRSSIPGMLFLAPAIVLFALFVVYPIVYNIQSSLLEWDGVNAGLFVGLDNYAQLFQDPVFHTTIRNSALWIPLTIVPQAAIGLLLALALNSKIAGSTIYRALFFIPAILSPIVVGIVWQRIMDPFNGVLVSVGNASGIEWLGGNFLANPDTAIFAVIFVNVWMWTGFSMLFYLAGLQLIDSSLLEAAKVDGASWWQSITRIVFPLLKHTHLSLLMLGIIGSLKTFELVYVLTEGGPNHASEMLPTFAFQEAFQLQSVGYASAISVVLIVVAVAASLSMVRVFGAGFITGEEKAK